MPTGLQIPLRGAGGEPVDLRRTLASHGVASLPPMLLDETAWALEVTLPLSGRRSRTVVIGEGRRGHAGVEVLGRKPGTREAEQIEAAVRHVLALDLDMAPFYRVAAEDPDLSWVAGGAGRMIRSPTVFEDVVKTLCTTNCSWALTTRMVTALVEHLGEPAATAPSEGWRGRAFPTPGAMAEQDEAFYRDVVRAGYRAPHFLALARMVAEGRVDLEPLGHRPPEGPPDEEVEERLLALPGIGPYAAAHVMLLVGRYHRLILDSWTRPTYARIRGSRRPISDAAIVRRFAKYGSYAGLAFWCYLTRSWVPEQPG
jgi:3-methyladenine DNA glycosylase/8-oxoguanine DNA glycosylase